MFPFSLRSALVALVASAVAVSATPGLTLTLSGADKVDGVHNLKITATVKNTGDETLRLLNDPHGVLNKLPTEAFQITHSESGKSPAFMGARAKYVPATAAKIGKNFTVLAPGEETSVEHDLSAAFNFTTTGPGSYSFVARNQFFFVDPETNAPVELYANHPEAHNTAISGKLVVPRATNVKRATYTGCSSSQQSQLVSAASAAQKYAMDATIYGQKYSDKSTPRFATWFGTFSHLQWAWVNDLFTSLILNDYSAYNYDCTCTDDSYAHAYADEYTYIHICNAFWSAPLTGTDSKAGTIIHESALFNVNGGAKDFVFGQAAAKSLALSDPSSAIHSAANYEYFAENNPSLA